MSDPNVGAPTIISQPVDKAVSPGQAATFLVRASGTGSLWYQWRRNGVPLDAATLAVYATDPTALGDDGATFDVVVKNVFGSVTSRPAKLAVHTGGPKTLTLHTTAATGAGDAPFIAFQDGDGPWQAATYDPNGDHAFTVQDERFGVAVGDPAAGLGYVFQGTVAEVEDLFLPLGLPQEPVHPALATVVGIDADRAYIPGCRGTVSAPGGLLHCSFPAGTNDVVAVEDANIDPTAFIVQRGVWVFDTGTSALGTYDFGSARAFAPESRILTIHGVAPPFQGAEAGLRVRAGQEVVDYSFAGIGQFTNVDPNGDVFVPIRLLPPALLVPGDVQFASSRKRGERWTMSYSDWFSDTADRTMSFPNSFTSDASLASSTPYVRAQVDWVAFPELMLFTMNAATDVLSWSCAVSRGWLKGPQAQYAFPDFRGVGGWVEALAFTGGSVDVGFRADSYVDVKRSLALAIYDRHLVPPPGDTTRNVTSIVEDGVTLHVP